MNNLYRDIRTVLMRSGIAEGEAKAITLLLMEKVCGMTTTEALTNNIKGEAHREELLPLVQRVAKGEPVQYVLGEADFCGITINVKPGVLIPRKETEELVAWVVEEERKNGGKKRIGTLRILDIGTGSGCIAITLAKKLEKAEVDAWDVSDVALQVAKENARKNCVNVKVSKVDVLSNLILSTSTLDYYDVIVSNPPYICEEETKDIEQNVLEHEPRIALFVPDNDPLLFYRRIGKLGLQKLRGGGMLFFEINRRFGNEVMNLLQDMNYQMVELRQDMFGNNRMIKAIKPL